MFNTEMKAEYANEMAISFISLLKIFLTIFGNYLFL